MPRSGSRLQGHRLPRGADVPGYWLLQAAHVNTISTVGEARTLELCYPSRSIERKPESSMFQLFGVYCRRVIALQLYSETLSPLVRFLGHTPSSYLQTLSDQPPRMPSEGASHLHARVFHTSPCQSFLVSYCKGTCFHPYFGLATHFKMITTWIYGKYHRFP